MSSLTFHSGTEITYGIEDYTKHYNGRKTMGRDMKEMQVVELKCQRCEGSLMQRASYKILSKAIVKS
jgi:hypothetical protein